MNILLQGLLFLCLASLLSSSTVKRKYSRNASSKNLKKARKEVLDEAPCGTEVEMLTLSLSLSDEDERDSESIQITVVPVIPEVNGIIRASDQPTRKRSILSISNDLLAHIATFLEIPFDTLPLVCKQFNASLKLYTPQRFLTMRVGNIPNASATSDLVRLLRMNAGILSTNFDNLVSFYSIFTPESPEIIEYAVKVYSKNYSPELKSRLINRLFLRLWTRNNFAGVLKVLQCCPDVAFDLKINDTLISFVFWAVRQHNPLEVLKAFEQRVNIRWPLLVVLASSPISFEIIMEIASKISMIRFIEALAKSFTLSVPEMTEAEHELIYQRNARILAIEPEDFEGIKLFKGWASLCNELRYSILEPSVAPYFVNAAYIKRLFDYIQSIYTARNIVLAEKKMVCEALLISAVKGNYLNVFASLLNNSKVIFETENLRPLLLGKPDFLAVLSPSKFKKIFGIRNQVLLLEHNVIDPDQIDQIENIYERIRVLSVIFRTDPVNFRIQLKFLIHGEVNIKISTLIDKFVKETDNPACYVHHLLMCLDLKQMQDSELKAISRKLGNPKYIASLLEPRNFLQLDMFSMFDANLLYLSISGEEFSDFLQLSPLLKDERAKNLRNRFKLNWKQIFQTNHLYPSKIIKLFDIFGLEIGTFTTKFNDVCNFAYHYSTVYRDSRILFQNSHFAAGFVDLFLQDLATALYYSETRNEVLISNPFVLKSYGIFQLWMDRNLESFLQYSPANVGRMLVPILSDAFLKKVLFSIRLQEGNVLATRLFTHHTTRQTNIKVSIDSIAEVKSVLADIFPYLRENHFFHINLEVQVKFFEIVAKLDSLEDFEVLTAAISVDLMNEFLASFNAGRDDSPKLKEFLAFFFSFNRESNPLFPQSFPTQFINY
jgi:hypothetical protein